MTKPITVLRQRVIDDMAVRNTSPQVYACAVANFARFRRHSPSPEGGARCNRLVMGVAETW